ncbi:CBS domain-containing protein, partial [Sphingomonas faeni]|uniref:CBS domain-containing protein n=3 Tax=Sphingomonas TaxID=13687 RepID=UPI0020C7A0A2
KDAVAYFADDATHRTYPVVDEGGRLVAMVSRADALRWQVDGELPDTSIGEALSDSSQPTAYPHSPIGGVADLMVESGVGRIPIVEVGTNRVVGILSRHDLLKVRSARKRAEIDRT